MATPKPAMAEVEAFARAAARIDLRRYTLPTERMAVVIPSERYEPLPNLAGLYDPRACLQAFVGAKEAHITVTVARESDELAGFSVLIIPSAFKLEDETWERLSEYVQGGGSIVLSYGGGDSHPAIREIFGVEFLGDGGARDEISCRVAQHDVLGDADLLRCAARDPELRAARPRRVDRRRHRCQGQSRPHGEPARAGARGLSWHSRSSARLRKATPGPLHRLSRRCCRTVYGAVADAAGCGAPVECDTPEVEIALFSGEEDDIIVLLNHAPTECTAELTFERAVAADR